MTCADFAIRFPRWREGTLTETEARAFEQHAGECDACGRLLDDTSRIAAPPREVAPPPSLRDVTLSAVARRKAIGRWRRMAGGVAAFAAIALFLLVSGPVRKSASDFPGAGTDLLARARARPELAALDAAERDVQQALKQQPADTALASDLARIRRQREALQRMVAQVRL